MGTFVQFYTTLLGFVNFRLYNSIGLIYPPRFDTKSDELGGELGAFSLEGRPFELMELDTVTNGHVSETLAVDEDIQKKVDAIGDITEPENEIELNQENRPEETNTDTIDTFEAIGEGADVLPQPQISGTQAGTLFAPFSFFLSRETPRQPLEFILRAFGCKRIGWDAVLGDGAFTNNEYDTSITHQVVDRPPLAQASFPEVSEENTEESGRTSIQIPKRGGRMPGRIYVQPQWVWDCINGCKLLRPDLYAPGVTLPPHLSPWVKPTKGAYDPSAPLAEQEREGEAAEAEGLDEDEEDEEEDEESDAVDEPRPKSGDTSFPEQTPSDEHGMDIAASASDTESDSDASVHSDAPSSFAGFDSDSDALSSASESTKQQAQHQRELEAEAAGKSFSAGTTRQGTSQETFDDNNNHNTRKEIGIEARKKAARKRKAEEEELERRKMMMGRKKRKILEKMLYSNQQKDSEAERLRGKRRRIEAKAAGNGKKSMNE